VRKNSIGPRDVEIIVELLEEMRPEIILVAGDLSDPHGTHRMCKEAMEGALAALPGEPPELWHYRGAWQEWPVADADMLVPLSEEELRLKISAIFKHQSQKDRAAVPGCGRPRVLAARRGAQSRDRAWVDQLGLPEYFAMEALKVVRPVESEIAVAPTASPTPTSRG
jgi:glucosamine-6-phosphate deaminase